MSFTSLGLLDPLLRTLERLNYLTPTPIQDEAIPIILKGRDLMAAAQTGTGKTAGFALPLLHKLLQEGPRVSDNRTRALVLVPTRELAEQVLQSFIMYGQDVPLRSYAVYGGVSINPQMMALRKGVDVLVATPGRLLDLYRQNAVTFGQLQMLVLDEADRMLDLGFAEELDQIFSALPRKRQTLLFSATFSEAIRTLGKELLRDPLMIDISPRNAAAVTVKQYALPVDKKRKTELFLHLLAQRGWGQVLVFARTRNAVDQLVEALQKKGITADAIHGERPQPARLRALARFKAAEVQVLVATDVAARGLDIDALPHVVNLDLPVAAEDYVHRIGRTGRAGASGEAISLVSADEVAQLAAIEALMGQTLPRQEEPDFVPTHRVPVTTLGGHIVKKPKKPKKPKIAPGKGKSKIHLGNWFDES
ncbi:DEAD/DEAH box helicase [Halopseudomonas sp.]|uniref:DEAD/DEAH box helicase n=1 Tax=Halopseudomonas sp. TaxID=2901191 RepID=UPI0035654461